MCWTRYLVSWLQFARLLGNLELHDGVALLVGNVLWELRAAVSLARLRRDHGRHAEARDLVAPVYEWFTADIVDRAGTVRVFSGELHASEASAESSASISRSTTSSVIAIGDRGPGTKSDSRLDGAS